jgi:hypothetical protein
MKIMGNVRYHREPCKNVVLGKYALESLLKLSIPIP